MNETRERKADPMKKESKERIKELLSRLLQFVISNLMVMLVGFVAMLIVGMFAFDDAVEQRFHMDLFFYLGMLLGLALPFYHCYFRNHSEYKRFYLKKREEGYSAKVIMGMHMKGFAKYEFLVLLLISLALSPVPAATLGKTGISFLFASAGFLVDFLPVEILHNSSYLLRLMGWLLWDLYIAGLYFVCLRISYLT